MSTSIDERIVQMQFDNKLFEQNAQQSMSTLDKLKEKLNIGKSAEGLSAFDKLANSGVFQGMASNLDMITSRFGFMQQIATRVISDITGKIADMGERLVKEFTIEPITDGFKEYELKMGSVQTIMASSHKDLATVNKVLAELNTYSDKTIYSFSDMTASIGKFTNAGVDLDVAVKAIQGISNEAALSGANANEASRAMYNFAQALSSGAVKLIDWKSIENANMATQDFKQELLNSAVALKTVEQQSDGTYKALTKGANGAFKESFTSTTRFNDSLSSCWMTTDVLIDALSKYSDEQTDIGKRAFAAAQDVKTFSQMMDTLKEAAGSGWAESMEYILGDFNQAKEMWTGVNNIVGDIIQKSSDMRNKILKEGLQELGLEKYVDFDGLKRFSRENHIAMDDIVNSINKVAEAHGLAGKQISRDQDEVKKSLQEGWLTKDLFAEATANLQGNLVGNLVDSLQGAQIGQTTEEVKGLQETLKALGYDIGSYGSDGIFGPVTESALKAFQAANGLEETGTVTKETFDMLNKLGAEASKSFNIDSYLSNMGMNGRDLGIDAIYNSYKALASILGDVGGAMKVAFPPITGKTIYDAAKAIHAFSEGLQPTTKQLVNIRFASLAFFKSLDFVREGAVKLGGPIFKTIASGVSTVANDALSGAGKLGRWANAQLDAAKQSGLWDKAQVKLANNLRPFKTLIGNVYEGTKKYASTIDFSKYLDKLSLGFQKVAKFMDPYLNKLREGRNKMFDWMSKIDSNVVADKLSGWTTVVKDKIDKFANETVPNAVKKISKFFMSQEQLKNQAPNMGAAFENIREKVSAFIKDIQNGGEKVIKFFTSLKEKFTGLGKSASEITADGGGLQKVAKFLSQYITPGGILKIAAAVTGLVRAFVAFKKLQASIDTLSNISKFFKTATSTVKSFNKNPISKQILMIAGAITILCASVVALAKLKPEEVAQGFNAFAKIAGVLGGMTIALAALTKIVGGGKLEKSGRGILEFAASLVVLAIGMKALSMAMQDPSQIAAFVLFTGAIMAFFAAMNKFAPATGAIGDGMFKMAASLTILAIAMKLIGGMDIGSIFKGLLGIAGLFGIVGLAAVAFEKFGASMKAFGKASKQMMKIAASMALLAGAFLLFSIVPWDGIWKGLLGTALGLGVMIAAVTLIGDSAGKSIAGLYAIILAIGLMTGVMYAMQGIDFGNVAVGILAMAAALAVMAVAGLAINGLAGSLVVAAGVIAIFSAALLLLHVAIKALSGDFSGIVSSLTGDSETLSSVFEGLGGRIIAALSGFGSWVLNGLQAGWEAVKEFGSNFISSIGEALGPVKDTIEDKLSGAREWISGKLSEGYEAVTKFGSEMISKASSGLANFGSTVKEKLSGARDWVSGKLEEGKSAVTEWGAQMILNAGTALEPFAETVKSKFQNAKSWVMDGGLKDAIDGVTSFGSDMLTNLTSGLTDIGSTVGGYFTGIWSEHIQPAIANIPTDIYDWATGIPEKIIEGIKSIGPSSIGDAIKSLFGFGGGDTDTGTTEAGVAAGEGLIEGAESVDYASAGEGMTDDLVEGIIDGAGAVVDAGVELGGKVKDGVGEAIEGAKSFFASLFGSIFQGSEGEGEASEKGTSLIQKFIEAIESMTGSSYSAGSSNASQAVSGMGSQSGSTYTEGTNYAQGFINGLSSMFASVYEAARKLGEQARKGSHDGAGNGSPSVLGHQEGVWYFEGFINGMNSMGKKIYNSAYDTTRRGLKAVNKGAKLMRDIVNGSLNIDPTVRPVFDMSGLRSGISQANSMLAGTTSGMRLGASANFAFNARTSRQNDVVSAINKLGNHIDAMPRNTYTVGGVNYDDGSRIGNAVHELIDAILVDSRA